MKKDEQGDKSNSPLLRGLAILQTIAESPRALTVADLIEELDIPKPTLHRIVSQLEEAGYIQGEPNRRLTLGSRLKDIAFNVNTNRYATAPRHAILKALSREINETCNCILLDGDHTVYFDRVESEWPYRIDLKIGSHLPLHCTASGKLFLSHLPASQRKKLISATHLKRYTERTITDIAYLEEELKRTKEAGIGIDNEEFIAGMVAVSVPVFDATNKLCFAVAVHAPAIRKPLAELRQYIPTLKRAAAAMGLLYDESV